MIHISTAVLLQTVSCLESYTCSYIHHPTRAALEKNTILIVTGTCGFGLKFGSCLGRLMEKSKVLLVCNVTPQRECPVHADADHAAASSWG